MRFKSRGRGPDSIENKRNDTGLRFVLQPAEEGNQGALLWNDDRLPALIDWHDPVITHGLAQRTKLSQYCHGCGKCVKKALWQRWHACECGIGPVRRDLYSAFLAAYLEPPDILPSCAQYAEYWEGAEARLRAAHERVKERAKAGQVMPQSMGLARARARLPQSSSEPTQEPAFLLRGGRLEAWKEGSEPPLLEHEELSENEREDGEDPSILRRHHPLCDPGCHFQEDAKNY